MISTCTDLSLQKGISYAHAELMGIGLVAPFEVGAPVKQLY